jgi:hypothetical protein
MLILHRIQNFQKKILNICLSCKLVENKQNIGVNIRDVRENKTRNVFTK